MFKSTWSGEDTTYWTNTGNLLYIRLDRIHGNSEVVDRG